MSVYHKIEMESVSMIICDEPGKGHSIYECWLLRTVGLKDFSEMLVEHELDNFLPTKRYRYCNFLCCDIFVVLYWLAIELSVLKHYPLALTTLRLLIF